MKVVIDLDKVLEEGRITREEYERLRSLGVEQSGSIGFNLLIGFGVLATVGGAQALLPSGLTAIVLGLAVAAGGVVLSRNYAREWGLLGAMLLAVGAILASGGIVYLADGSYLGFLASTVLFLAAAIVGRNQPLAAVSVLSLAATVGGAIAGDEATYLLTFRQPAVTVVLFSLLGLIAFRLSDRLSEAYRGLALIFARTSLIVVNLGFWVGSLWGDSLWRQRNDWDFGGGELIPDWAFAIGWVVGLVALGIWAHRAQRRWAVNLAIMFGVFLFYTEFFRYVGGHAASFLIAGVLAIGFAFAIFRYNRRWLTTPDADVTPLNGRLAPSKPASPISQEV